MALRSAPLLLLVLVAVTLPESCFGSSSHSMKCFLTSMSDPSQGLPHFVALGYLDDQVLLYYDSNSRKMQPRVSWMEEVGKEDPQYWDRNTQRVRGHEEVFRAYLEPARTRHNESEDLHTWQWMCGCELHGNGSKVGFLRCGYDGKDFLTFDKEILTWVAPNPQAEVTRRKWDAIPGFNQRRKAYLEEECFEWLKKYQSYGKETLLRTEAPVVTVSSRTEADDGMETHICRMDGFYPKEIEASWRRDGELWLQDTFRGSVAPNADGTYHYWLSIRIDPQERDHYRCHVEHDGLQEPLDVALKGSSSHSVKYFYTIVSEPSRGLFHLVAVGYVDDQVFVYYDSNSRKVQPRVSWMEEVGKEDPQFWDNQAKGARGTVENLRTDLEAVRTLYNHSEGLHTWQWTFSCELRGNQSKGGFMRFGYDGRTFITFDKETLTWVVSEPQAQIIKRKWDAIPRYNQGWKIYLEEECIEWLEKYLSYGKEMLLRKEAPVVTVSSRTEADDGMETHVCRIYGFYPKEINASWRRDGEVWLQDTFRGSVASNADGTYHYWLSIRIHPQERGRYWCHVEHDGLREPMDKAVKGSSSHSLKYFCTAVSEPSQGLPQFVALGYLDDQVFAYYDSDSRKEQPQVSWMEKVGKEDPQLWDTQSKGARFIEENLRADMEAVRTLYNHSEGLHTRQWMGGCELQGDGSKGGFLRYGYDGRTFISFDKETLTWVASDPQAEIIKREWDAIPECNQGWKIFLEEECFEWLERFLSYGKETLLRTEAPVVTVSSRTEADDGMETHVCRVDGFYPKEINASWRRDGEVWLQDTFRGSVASNADGTYHYWLSIQIDPQEKDHYRCHVEHDGLREPVDKALKGSSSHSLKYFFTFTLDPSQALPHFVAPGYVDDQVFIYYDSNSRKVQSGVSWMEKVWKEHPQYRYTNIRTAHDMEAVLRADLEALRSRYNHSEGLHTWQWMGGCELQGDGSKGGFLRYGYDGRTFISFDKETLTWVAPEPQAQIAQRKWDSIPGFNQRRKAYLEEICIRWLEKSLFFGKERLLRTDAPVVTVSSRTEADDGMETHVCRVDGFYPKEIDASWRRDGEVWLQDTFHGSVAPNADGTYHYWLSIQIDPQERDHYWCHVEHDGLRKPVDKALKGSPSHSLKYFYTSILDSSQGLPHFAAPGYLDDQLFSYYDSNTRKVQPAVSWMEKVGKEDPQYWDDQTQRGRRIEKAVRANLKTVRTRYNQSEGLHTWQWTSGCELRGDGSKGGFLRYGYDGRTFISFDKETLTWVAPEPQAQIAQRKWDSIPGFNQRRKYYLEEVCIEWLKKHLSYGKETLLRTEAPVVTVSSRTEADDGMETHVCRVDGFYPKEINASWRRDGEVWLQDTFRGSVAPNADGTYHYWLSIRVDPQERDHYRCHVEHDSLQEPVDVDVKESSLGLIISCVVAAVVLVIAVIVGILVYFKKRQEGYEETLTSDSGSDSSGKPEGAAPE
ncbi:uncharacterized protein PHA67_002265 isoform 7-T7 [Liasis olivaceus]